LLMHKMHKRGCYFIADALRWQRCRARRGVRRGRWWRHRKMHYMH
jgi:hypothetical protein